MNSANDLLASTASSIAADVRARKLSAVEVTRGALARIDALNPQLRAFITVMADQALAEAAAVDQAVAAGRVLPLAGVPIAVKDSFDVAGVPTTAGSKILAGSKATADAESVKRLRDAGCVVLGKSSLHEFAYGFTSRNPHYGDCRNPWDLSRVPGGSSGGNAVALATGMALGAIGGDTGGSIRLPAALCGIVGLKVTYGRVSRHGGVPLSWSIDTVGPMTRTVADAAHLLQAMAGHDSKDPACSRLPVPDYVADLGRDLKGVRIGIPHRGFFEPLDPEVGGAMQESLEALRQTGAQLVDVDWPSLEPVVGAHRAILFAEASAAHEPMIRARAAELSDDVRPLLQSGLFLTSGQYLAAQQARRKIIEQYRRLWRGFDLLVTPTSPIPAPEIGTTSTKLGDRDVPLVRAFLDLTLPFNLTGQPALALPCGFTRAGLPVGLQLVGRPFAERLLLQAGAAFEAARALPGRVPAVVRN